MSSNLKPGWMIELAAGRLLDAFRLIPVLASLKKSIVVCFVKMPRVNGSVAGGPDPPPDFSMERSTNCTVRIITLRTMLFTSKSSCWPGASIWFSKVYSCQYRTQAGGQGTYLDEDLGKLILIVRSFCDLLACKANLHFKCPNIRLPALAEGIILFRGNHTVRS